MFFCTNFTLDRTILKGQAGEGECTKIRVQQLKTTIVLQQRAAVMSSAATQQNDSRFEYCPGPMWELQLLIISSLFILVNFFSCHVPKNFTLPSVIPPAFNLWYLLYLLLLLSWIQTCYWGGHQHCTVDCLFDAVDRNVFLDRARFIHPCLPSVYLSQNPTWTICIWSSQLLYSGPWAASNVSYHEPSAALYL